MDDVLATVPSVSKLGSKDPTQSLRHVNLNEKLTEINGDDRLPKISDNGKKAMDTIWKKRQSQT